MFQANDDNDDNDDDDDKKKKKSRRRVGVEWKPYLLDKSFPLEKQPIEEFAERKFGSGWKKGFDRIRKEGAKDGAPFADWKWRCNTLKALQLVEFAHTKDGIDTSKTKQALFEALYEHGQDVSDMDTLVRIAMEQQVGLSPSLETELREYLENDKGADEIHRQIKEGVQKYRIRGVPFFVVQDDDQEGSSSKPYGISGAHDPETFLELFEELSGEAN